MKTVGLVILVWSALGASVGLLLLAAKMVIGVWLGLEIGADK